MGPGGEVQGVSLACSGPWFDPWFHTYEKPRVDLEIVILTTRASPGGCWLPAALAGHEAALAASRPQDIETPGHRDIVQCAAHNPRLTAEEAGIRKRRLGLGCREAPLDLQSPCSKLDLLQTLDPNQVGSSLVLFVSRVVLRAWPPGSYLRVWNPRQAPTRTECPFCFLKWALGVPGWATAHLGHKL